MNKSIALLLTIFVSPSIAMKPHRILENRFDLAVFQAADQDSKLAPTIRQIELDVDLYEAIGYGDVERAKYVLDAGGRIGKETEKLYSPATPLICAVKSAGDCIPMCQLLLKHGAPIDEPSEDDELTPLMQAAVDGLERTCEFLLRNGANIWARDKDNNTALLLVVKKYRENRNKYSKKIGALQCIAPDPIWIDHMNDLKSTAQFFVAYQTQQENSMLTFLACLKYFSSSAIHEIYRQKDTLLVKHLKQFLLKPFLEARNDEGKNLHDYE